MTPEKRHSVLHRPWTLEEAIEALRCLRSLENEGQWGDNPPTPAMKELAEAVHNLPAGITTVIKSKIINALEAKLLGEGLIP